MSIRTTIRLNEDLARRAKRRAKEEHISFTKFIEDSVQEKLQKGPSSKPRQKIVLPTFGDPSRKMSEEDYRRAIDQMYEEEAERIMKGYK